MKNREIVEAARDLLSERGVSFAKTAGLTRRQILDHVYRVEGKMPPAFMSARRVNSLLRMWVKARKKNSPGVVTNRGQTDD